MSVVFVVLWHLFLTFCTTMLTFSLYRLLLYSSFYSKGYIKNRSLYIVKTMNINVPKEKTYKRKADNQGRINLPTSEYAGKTLEIGVLDTIEDEDED